MIDAKKAMLIIWAGLQFLNDADFMQKAAIVDLLAAYISQKTFRCAL